MLYVLDEPTTVLSLMILKLLDQSVASGNSVIVTEIDVEGGYIIAEGTVEQLINNSNSMTEMYKGRSRKIIYHNL